MELANGPGCQFMPNTAVEQYFVRRHLVQRAAAEQETVSDIQAQYYDAGMDVGSNLIRDTLHKVVQDNERPSTRLLKQQITEADEILDLFAERNADLRKILGPVDANAMMRDVLAEVRKTHSIVRLEQ